MKDKTILEKIGISDEVVKKWKKEGLKITYPIKQNLNWFKSADGEVFWENADKFVPLLTKKETKLYIKSPKRFREDFLKNLRFYRKFCNFVDKTQKRTEKLKAEEKVTALLSLIYLFQRAMDYHYYHWDRYIVYEEYPQTPVGYWWQKIKDLYTKVTKKKVLKQNPPEDFLRILVLDKEILEKFRKHLSKNNFLQLQKTLKAIKIFQDAQQKEAEIITRGMVNANIFVNTGFPMLDKFWKELKKHPELVKKGDLPKIKKIKKLHPIITARRLLLIPTLKCFDEEIFFQFKKEIQRWL